MFIALIGCSPVCALSLPNKVMRVNMRTPYYTVVYTSTELEERYVVEWRRPYVQKWKGAGIQIHLPSNVSENELTEKRPRLSLSLNGGASTAMRFEFLDNAREEALGKKFVPQNTKKRTQWVLSTFLTWCNKCNECLCQKFLLLDLRTFLFVNIAIIFPTIVFTNCSEYLQCSISTKYAFE